MPVGSRVLGGDGLWPGYRLEWRGLSGGQVKDSQAGAQCNRKQPVGFGKMPGPGSALGGRCAVNAVSHSG